MPKILIYTFTYNNADILPFVIDYWKSYATKVVVYDNMSTDGTINLLLLYDWIELRLYDTNNKYDIDKINLIKHKCISNSKLLKNIDYVLVCDIDEVLRYTDDLDKVLTAGITNKSNVNLNYYEVLFNKFPNYLQDILLQNYVGFAAVESLHISKKSVKPVLINLHANNSKSYITLEMLHLKFLSLQYLLNKQNQKLRRARCSHNFIYDNNNESHSIYNDYYNCLMNNRYKYLLKRLRNNITTTSNTVKPYGMTLKLNTNDIPWIKTKIRYTSVIKNKQCVIVIPVYKTYLEEYEIASMIQLINTVGNEYDICLVCPDGLYTNYYNNICNYKFNYLKCNPEYFKSTYTYSKLLENYYFYEAFRQYEYMMIYLNDGWIFYNNIKYFILLNYDYIGSPWGENEFEPSPESVGNGGVSFRKISKFIDICHNITPKDLLNRYAKWEDLFFCKCIAKKDKTFKIAPVRVAVKFSLDFNVQKWIKKYNANPMCAHAFNKHINEWAETGRVIQYDITNNITPLHNTKLEPLIYNSCKIQSTSAVDTCKIQSNSVGSNSCKIQSTSAVDTCKIQSKYDDACKIQSTSAVDTCKTLSNSDVVDNSRKIQSNSIDVDACKTLSKSDDACKMLLNSTGDACKMQDNSIDVDACKTLSKSDDACKMQVNSTDVDACKTLSKSDDACKIQDNYVVDNSCKMQDNSVVDDNSCKIQSNSVDGDACKTLSNSTDVDVSKTLFNSDVDDTCKIQDNSIDGDDTCKIQDNSIDVDDNSCKMQVNSIDVDTCKIQDNFIDDVLIAIFNYKHDDNAKKWLNILSPYFDAYVLDSGNTETVSEFMQFPNIYYGGLFNETKKLAEKKNYKWVGIITSDVIIDDAEIDKLIDRLKTLKTMRNVGIWSLIGDKNGHSNRYVYAQYKSEFYRTLEGFFIFTNAIVFNLVPYIDTTINLYGHGIDYLQCYLSNKMGYINIVDEDINIYHPKDKGYNATEARKQSKKYQKYLKVLLNDPDYITSGISFNTIQNDYEKMVKYKSKKVIYTCISGNYDTLYDDIYVNPDWDYVCFTDLPITSNVWEIRPIPKCLKDLSLVKQQRILKIQSHIYLNEYDEAIWCDANILMTSNFDELLNVYNSPILLFKKHPHRTCVYEELAACVKYKKENKEMTDFLLKRYLAELMPKNFGLYETGVFYRSLHDERVCKLMDMWANELINNSHRDQLSLTYCIWKLNCKDIISEFDTSDFNKYCKLLKHKPKKI